MSVVCDKCGEPLMGAVNRCWKCGAAFARVAANDQPPLRRAPVMAAYLTATQVATPSPTVEEVVILAEAADAAVTAQAPTPTTKGHVAWKSALRRIDGFSLAAAALAIFACWLTYRGPLGVLFGGLAVICGLQRIRLRRTWATWAAFLLATVAMNFALVRLMAYLYTAMTGADLFIVLFRT